jgi:hypothetical protein
MKDVASDKFPNGHGQIGNQANARNADPSIVFVRGGEVDISMVMVVVVMVAVTTVASSLAGHLGDGGSVMRDGRCLGGGYGGRTRDDESGIGGGQGGRKGVLMAEGEENDGGA